MKLNHDCVRKLLLFLEENLECTGEFDLSCAHIDGFSYDDLFYTSMKLKEAGYINATIHIDICGEGEAMISCITWDGHKFLDTIRDNQVWSNTKKILSKVSSTSITFVSNVASQVLTNLINQQLGLNEVGTTS